MNLRDCLRFARMGRRRGDLGFLLVSAWLVLLISCAQPITPTGGPEDDIRPKIIRTWPENGTLQYRNQKVTFQFSEYVKSSNLKKDIFITPIQDPGPEMRFVGRKLIIEWDDPLNPNTTYVLQPGKGLKDITANNELDSLFQFAFSTGDYLDSCEVNGKVINPLTGKGAEGVTLMLFHPDSVLGDSILRKRPEYACISDAAGSFRLAYLACKPYKVYGVQEEDGNYQYNSLKEGLALAQNNSIDFSDSTHQQVELQVFTPDPSPPRLLSKTWLSYHIMDLEWSEPLRSISESKLQIVVSDTNQVQQLPVRAYELKPGEPKRLRLFMQDSVGIPVSVRLEAVSDTLLNTADTTFIMNPRRGRYYYPLRLKQNTMVERNDTIFLESTEPLSEVLPDTAFYWLDTAGVKTPAIPLVSGTTLKFATEQLPDKSISWQLLNDSAMLAGYSGNRADTVYRFQWKASDADAYGSASGTLKDSLLLPLHPLLLRIEHIDSRKIWYIPNGHFQFTALPASELQILAIEDTDGNGRWTPGSLHPYRMPERCYPIHNLPKIRAGWEMEDMKMVIQEPQLRP
jgi:hypothetical protein